MLDYRVITQENFHSNQKVLDDIECWTMECQFRESWLYLNLHKYNIQWYNFWNRYLTYHSRKWVIKFVTDIGEVDS